jgi:hypothetical protein
MLKTPYSHAAWNVKEGVSQLGKQRKEGQKALVQEMG